MKRTLVLMAAASLLAACHDARELNQASVTQALTRYLDQRGDLCLAKNSWPVDVTEREAGAGSRNAVQMPVLERLGLVAAVDAEVELPGADGSPVRQKARRYTLTEEGRKYYLARPARKTASGNRFADADHDLCAARLSLDRVVGWERGAVPGTFNEAVVTYTYHVQSAPWTQDAAARAVFPMVDTVIRGAGTMQLKETLVLAPSGWEARDL